MSGNYLVKWSDVDPSATEEQFNGFLGRFVAPNVGDNPFSANMDMVSLFDYLVRANAAFSVHRMADDDMLFPDITLVLEALKVIDSAVNHLMARHSTSIDRCEMLEHDTPTFNPFMLTATMYPLQQTWANQFVGSNLSIAVHISQLSDNRLDSGMRAGSVNKIICRYLKMKGRIMAQMFGLEPRGHTSFAEFNELMKKGFEQDVANAATGSLITGDHLPYGEQQVGPTTEDIDKTRTGTPIVSFRPSSKDLMIFDAIAMRSASSEALSQPELAYVPAQDVTDAPAMRRGANMKQAPATNLNRGNPLAPPAPTPPTDAGQPAQL